MALAVVLGSVATLAIGGCADSHSARPSENRSNSIAFTDVTQTAGLADFRHENGRFGQAWAPEIVGAGGGFIDYDGDGWIDILLVAGGTFRSRPGASVDALRLYKNLGDGTFAERTREAGLDGIETYGFGIVAADYDNDGDQDFLLTTLYENLLFRNDGGTFTEVGAEAGLADRSEWSTSAMFFDADRDGHLDLYVGNYVDWSPDNDIYCGYGGEKVYCTPQEYEGIASRYYHNNGDGTFTDQTDEAGFLPIPGKVFGVVELDYNKDGWSDLFVAEDTERDLLYENRGDGTFVERGVQAGVAFDHHGKPRAGMGADAAVVDSTGEVSLFVGNFSHETVGVYRHLGNGLFVDRVAVAGLSRPSLMTLTFGLLLFDVDLDQDLDLLLANGHVQTHIESMHESVSYRQPVQLFLNEGGGTFEEFDAGRGVLSKELLARGAAYGDYDRDGDLDILLTENHGPAHLWRNDIDGGHVLRVRLQGRQSSRDAIGSRVVAVLGNDRMERRIRTGSSYLSQSEKTAVFGMDGAERLDSLLVYWASGRIDRFSGPSANQEVLAIEGEGRLRRQPVFRADSNSSEALTRHAGRLKSVPSDYVNGTK